MISVMNLLDIQTRFLTADYTDGTGKKGLLRIRVISAISGYLPVFLQLPNSAIALRAVSAQVLLGNIAITS